MQVPTADLGSFLTLDGISIDVQDAVLDGDGHLVSGSATVSVGNAELFPGWETFGASITDGDDADAWAMVGGYDVTTGFSLTVDQFSLSVDQVFTAQAEGISIGYNVTEPATLSGGTGIDRLKGGSGDDSIYGQDGRDFLQGGPGQDRLYPGTGDDQLEGGTGDDRYVFAAGFNNVQIVEQPGEGTDVVDLSAMADLNVAVGSLAVSNSSGGLIQYDQGNVEQILLGAGNDTIRVTAPSSGLTLNAGGGSDTLIGPDAGATFTVDGADAGSVVGSTAPRSEASGSKTSSPPSGLAFTGIENLSGGAGADRFAFGPAGSISGDVDGGDGSDRLDYSGYGQSILANLQTRGSTAIGGTFGHIEQLVGSDESDDLVGPDAGATFAVDGADAGDVGGLAFERIENLSGAAGDDTFAFLPGGKPVWRRGRRQRREQPGLQRL